jgi:hypothetical protein
MANRRYLTCCGVGYPKNKIPAFMKLLSKKAGIKNA